MTKIIKRTIPIEDSAVDAETRTVKLSFSSETPIVDWPGEPPNILLHTKRSADFKRIREIGAVLLNHNPDKILGRVVDIGIDEKDRKGRATVVLDETEEGDLALTRIQSGSLRGVSVTAPIRERQIVREDETWKSQDGRTWKGPVWIATKWEVVDLSFTPIAADSTVGVGRTQQKKESDTMKLSAEIREFLISRGLAEGSTDEEAMEFMRTLQLPKKEEPKKDPEEKKTEKNEPEETAIRAIPRDDGSLDPVKAIQEERKRIDDLQKIIERSGMPDSELQQWIHHGTSTARAREIAMEFMAERYRPVSVTGTRFEVTLDAREKYRNAMEAALCRRAYQALEGNPKGFSWDEKACADVPRDLPLVEIARQCMVHAGYREAAGMDRVQVVQRAFQHSTSDFPYLLANVAEKSLGVGYEEARATWRAWCGTGSLPDFKTADRVAFGSFEDWSLVKELMPIPETSVSEKREQRSLGTYGQRFGISRQALINDDLGEFARTPQQLGAAAARSINTLVYQQLTSPPTMAEDSTALFATTHTSGSNTTVEAGGVSIAGLTEAMANMRKQTGLGGTGRMNIIPRFLVVPAAQETAARQIVQTQLWPATAANAPIEWMLNLVPVVEPLLDDTATTTYYLAASPNEVDTIRVEFLNGRETPSIMQIEGDAILGMQWVAYHDWSVKVFDHRGLSRVTAS